ncbi:MAG: ABC transporter permease subunit [Planctomycetes bacterium]|nr:ABC transporter permease subunit [Planctomycetota bacterium]
MTAGIFKFCRRYLDPGRWTGPIFDKELRISSRRKRNYWLRFAYLAAMTGFVILTWNATVTTAGTSVYQVSRMSQAGVAIIASLAGFQFVILQLIAVIMLSNAISGEINSRTLGILMTTPINSFQIVMGKLLSKLLQLMLLLAISLPLLAVVRVFGGVPWDYVLSSVCITLTAVIFAGTLSMYFSISARPSYAIILKTIFVLGILYIFIPAMAGAILGRFSTTRVGLSQEFYICVFLTNPFVVMWTGTLNMVSPAAMGLWPVSLSIWPLHCGVMLVASSVVLARAVRVVRRVALAQAIGQVEGGFRQKRRADGKISVAVKPQTIESEGQIRHVEGSPIVWKELRKPIIQGGRKNGIIGLSVAIGALLITYIVNLRNDLLTWNRSHVTYTLIFVVMGLISNIVLSATAITSEKESRCWPILLTTALDDWRIITGKAIGMFYRCLPIWLFLAGHVILFALIGWFHWIAIVQFTVMVACMAAFITGSGIYFSTCFRRTTSAVVANTALAMLLWAVIPSVLGLLRIDRNSNIQGAYMTGNPIVQAVVITEATAGRRNAETPLRFLRYDWPDMRRRRFGDTTAALFSWLVIYIVGGVLLAWMAKRRLRKKVFYY